ncbi:carboxypeptidase regulatory-like domain-containing protein [Myxococcus sp. 1LA]
MKFEGTPVPDAVVVLTPTQEWDDAMALGTKRYPVRPDGTFVLTNVPRIQWRLSVEAPGKSQWVRFFNGRERADYTGVNATLERAATLRGRVLSPERRPMAGVQVTRRGPSSQEVATVVTDARGRFVLDHLRPGSYSLKVSASNGDLLTQRVELDTPEARDVEWVLRKRSDPAVLRIRVLTAGGKPVPGAELLMGGGGGMNGFTDAQGRWHTDEVRPTVPSVHWKGRIYRSTLESVSIPYPEEVVVTIPDAEF